MLSSRKPAISQPIRIGPDQHTIKPRKISRAARSVIGQLQEAGYDAYIVGGGVRDLLLGRNPKDFDVATDASPEEVKVIFRRCRLIGRRFRLAHVREHGEVIEVATFRGGADSDGVKANAHGRILRDNVFGSEHEDALRRDFTVNALFYDPTSNEIRDYVGGFEDLQARRLRLIGDPDLRYREDPVRLLRAARFEAKLGLTLDQRSAAPVAEVSHLLTDVPPARLFEETLKLFLTGHALASFQVLQAYRLTPLLFPVLAQQKGGKEVVCGPLLKQALINTDERVAESKPVTPAFLYAVLLWQPVRDRAERLEAGDMTRMQALQAAADEVIEKQVRMTAIPRRFSAVVRQIWLMQPRFRYRRGKRAASLLADRRFRAAYDFLLLRTGEDPSLQEAADWWTDIQELTVADRESQIFSAPKAGKKRRRRRPRKRKAASQN